MALPKNKKKVTDEALKTLTDITRLLQNVRSGENPLENIVHLVRKAMKVNVCSLYILQNNQLVMVATDGLNPEAIGKVKMPLEKGLTGLIAETCTPFITNEARSHPRYMYFPETGEEHFESFAGVPILDRANLVGVLTIQTRKTRRFSTDITDLLSVISFQLSGVIRNLVTLEAFRKKAKGRNKVIKFEGLAASPGFTAGPAFILKNQFSLQVPQTETLTPTAEKKRLREAIQKASQDLIKLEKKLLKKLSQNESDIFNAHRVILKDRSFKQKLYKEIEAKQSAEQAVVNVIGDYVKTFSSISDDYLRDRATDLEDLGQRLLEKLTGTERNTALDYQGILVAERLTPSETALLDPEKIQGIVTVHGGHTGHAAILARSLGIPAIMGVPADVMHAIKDKELVIVNGNTGEFYINPPKDVLNEYEKLQQKQAGRLMKLNTLADQAAVTKDGKLLHLDANVGLVNSLQYLRHYGADGVGLYRTEFPFMVRESLPNEEQQYQVYRRILESAEGIPVTFRTLDAGGDKPISYLHLADDDSFLGYRSIRLCLSEPEILRTQLYALYRAAVHGPMRILFPMISGIEEIIQVKALIQEVLRGLKKRKGELEIPDVPIGIMVEVPAAVQMAEHLIQEVDFFSIGTNDLIQFTLAVDRNNEKVASFFEPFHPAVIRSLYQVVQAAHKYNKWVSICGEMAGDPMMTALLIGLGFDRLSMIPANIPLVKQVIQELHYKKLQKEIDVILKLSTTDEIKKQLSRYLPKKSQ